MTTMAKPRPRVLVTRRLTADVEARLARGFEATLNAEDRPMPREEILRKAEAHDALLVTSIDRLGPGFVSTQACTT